MEPAATFGKSGDIKVGRDVYLVDEVLSTEPESSYLLRTTDSTKKLLRGSFLESALVEINLAEQTRSSSAEEEDRSRLQLYKEAAAHRPVTRAQLKP